jgi:hypothetical protein
LTVENPDGTDRLERSCGESGGETVERGSYGDTIGSDGTNCGDGSVVTLFEQLDEDIFPSVT